MKHLMIFFIVLALLILIESKFIFQEKNLYENRFDFQLTTNRPNLNEQHEVVIAIKQLNIPYLQDLLLQVSTPNHINYGKHLNRVEIANLTQNLMAEEKIQSYFAKSDVQLTRRSKYGEYYTLKATFGQLEKLFNTTFYEFQSINQKHSVYRGLEYSIDEELVDSICLIFNLVHLPTTKKPKGYSYHSNVNKNAQLPGSSITIAKLNSYYNITTNTGNLLGSQSVFETSDEHFSPADLKEFQTIYGLPIQPVATVVGGHDSDAACNVADLCIESNLDVQYMMGISQVTPMTYWYQAGQDSFIAWVDALVSSDNPPKVNSMSWGDDESGTTQAVANQFDVEAMKLGLQGVTITISSGDDGAVSYTARTNPFKCSYDPSYPATSNYVTAVGATQGPETNTVELVCSSDTGGVITSGGGFSTLYTKMDYQSSAISGYFNSVTGSKVPASGYATNGRGIPDVSLAGVNYNVIIGGTNTEVSGTSASSPSFAAFVALVNAARLSQGKSTLGWLNPAIYQYGSQFGNDVVTGNNKCTAGIVCCSQGFYAAPGWDPATGFGGVDFNKFYNIMVNL